MTKADGCVTGISEDAPHSLDLLATLISLLADQENVNITYEFEKG